MIGQLINEFESGTIQTVSRFNELFRHCPIVSNQDLEVYSDDEVEIGEPFNTTRQITIRGYTFYHEMKFLEPLIAPKTSANSKHVKVYLPDNTFVGEFIGLGNAAYALNLSREQFNYRVSVGKFIVEEVEQEDETNE